MSKSITYFTLATLLFSGMFALAFSPNEIMSASFTTQPFSTNAPWHINYNAGQSPSQVHLYNAQTNSLVDEVSSGKIFNESGIFYLVIVTPPSPSWSLNIISQGNYSLPSNAFAGSTSYSHSTSPVYDTSSTSTSALNTQPTVHTQESCINLNSADFTTLRSINGVDIDAAVRIMKYRRLVDFRNLGDLSYIVGMDSTKVAAIQAEGLACAL